MTHFNSAQFTRRDVPKPSSAATGTMRSAARRALSSFSIGDVAVRDLIAAIAMVNHPPDRPRGGASHADPALMFAAAEPHTSAPSFPTGIATAFVGVIDPATQRCTLCERRSSARRSFA